MRELTTQEFVQVSGGEDEIIVIGNNNSGPSGNSGGTFMGGGSTNGPPLSETDSPDDPDGDDPDRDDSLDDTIVVVGDRISDTLGGYADIFGLAADNLPIGDADKALLKKWESVLSFAELAYKAGTLDRDSAEDLLGDAISDILQNLSEVGAGALGAYLGSLTGNPYAAFLAGFFSWAAAFTANSVTQDQYDMIGDAVAAAIFDIAEDGPAAFAAAVAHIVQAMIDAGLNTADSSGITLQNVIDNNTHDGVIDWGGVFENLFGINPPSFD
ncbi:MAG: hypothetical protein ACWA44_10695 [Thiotrichales bacterium]